MLAMIMALALGGAAAAETDVTCALTAEGEAPQVERFIAVCPSDHPEAAEIQAAADAVLGAVSLPLPEPDRRLGAHFIDLADSLVMRGSDAGWAAAPGQILVRVEPAMPVRAVEMGARHMACAVALRPDANGVPVDPQAVCRSGRQTNRVRRLTEPAMLDAAARMRLAPVDIHYCMDEQIAVRIQIVYRGSGDGPSESRVPASDVDALPRMCERQG